MSLEENKISLDNWKNHSWEQAYQGDPRITFWRAADVNEPLYCELCDTTVSAVTESVNRTVALLETTVSPIEVALFPHSTFRTDMDLPVTIPDWVNVCIRDSRISYDVAAARQWKDKFELIPADERRELTHEVAHRLLPEFDFPDMLTPLHVYEGAVETIARILTGIQADLPESTRFITSDLADSLISPADIDSHGMFSFSREPLSVNPAYLSSLVYIVGATLNLSGDIRSGLLTMRQLAVDSRGKDKFSGNLRETLTVSDPRLLQLAGIDYIGDTFPTTSK